MLEDRIRQLKAAENQAIADEARAKAAEDAAAERFKAAAAELKALGASDIQRARELADEARGAVESEVARLEAALR